MFGIVGDLVLAAVSVVHFDDQHVNGEHVTERENANSKQRELEAGERVEYQEPFHRPTPGSILDKSMSCLRSSCKGHLKPAANWFNCRYTCWQGALVKTRLLTFLCSCVWS